MMQVYRFEAFIFLILVMTIGHEMDIVLENLRLRRYDYTLNWKHIDLEKQEWVLCL